MTGWFDFLKSTLLQGQKLSRLATNCKEDTPGRTLLRKERGGSRTQADSQGGAGARGRGSGRQAGARGRGSGLQAGGCSPGGPSVAHVSAEQPRAGPSQALRACGVPRVCLGLLRA